MVSCCALVAAAQTSTPGQPVIATIDASKTGPPISPYVYGQFLEQIGNLIYDSLWSEMLDDRKFYYAVAPKSADDNNSAQRGFGGGRRRGVGPGRWNPVGPADSVVMDADNPFVGEHSPLIWLVGSEPRGICQTGINFVEGDTYAAAFNWPAIRPQKFPSALFGAPTLAPRGRRLNSASWTRTTRNVPSLSKQKNPAPPNLKSPASAKVHFMSARFR